MNDFEVTDIAVIQMLDFTGHSLEKYDLGRNLMYKEVTSLVHII